MSDKNEGCRHGKGDRITELWAWVSIDPEDDCEGIGAMLLGSSNTWTPMVGADRERIESYRPHAKVLADISGRPFHLVRFASREEVETIG